MLIEVNTHEYDDTKNGGKQPCNHAKWIPEKSIAGARYGRTGIVVQTDDGETYHIGDEEWDRRGETVVPAQPGFFALYWCGNDGGKAVYTAYPILAWRISHLQYAKPAPVIVHMNQECANWPILQPDGRVINAELQEWDTLEDWAKEQLAPATR